MFSCTDESGQTSVEAAFLLPVLLLVLGVFVQPAILLYDRAVMRSAAAEACRVVATSAEDGSEVGSFVRRRLAAVPNVSAFHEGGASSWDVSWEGPDEAGETVVSVTGRARPLPLFGVAAGLAGNMRPDGTIEIRVEERSVSTPAWAQSSGSAQEWIGAWK